MKLDEEKETKINELNSLNAKLAELSKEDVTQDIDTKVHAPDVETGEGLERKKNKLGIMFKSENKFKVFFAIGAVTLLACLLTQWYPTSVINGLNESLKQPNLPIEETWKLQGSLAWWNNSFITIFQPVSTFLFVASILLSGYSIIQIWRRILFLSKY